jgi:eukaryotic-like serine/threonine-protein kinase
MIGKILGQYEIQSRLGAGGMGEVYRARDTRLGRSVAIKLLPEAFVEDRDRAGRFEREAKALAALNHPNVATLYGFEECDGACFLAMELIEGETLSERIGRGPIAAEEAFRILHQIAEALEAAHAKGIIHRDLKPGNIKLTPEGVVKVLDFGLAKALDPSRTPTPLSHSPTAMTAMDSGAATGVMLGTAGYMSPEQAKGRAADERSDVFSFGCVLYEMLTGMRPFPGDSLPEVMAGVIAREPDLAKLPANLNPRVPELLRRCLDKDPRRRWHAIADARVEIAAILADPHGTLTATPLSRGRSSRQRALTTAVALLIGAAIGAPAIWFFNAAPAKTVKRFTFTLEGIRFSNTGRQFLSIAPDGSQFVFTAGGRLQLKPLRELEPIAIQGPPQGNLIGPAFSPDGQSIVYNSGPDRALKRVPAAGGAPITLCPVEQNPMGISWGNDDHILFGQTKGILRVSANAGEPEVAIPAVNGEILHGPQLLPDGKSILFTASDAAGTWEKAKIVVQTRGSNDRKVLVDNATDGRYLPTGHLVYYSGGNLVAVAFDVKKLMVSGRAAPVVEGVRMSGGSGAAEFSVSNNGTLIYAEGAPGAPTAQGTLQGGVTIVLLSPSGTVMPTALLPNNYVSVRFSPDEKQIAVGTDDGKEANIWVYDLAGKAAIRRLTFGGRNLYPLWSGDGERILYQSDREGDKGIFWQRADGTGMAERITKPEKDAEHMPESWLPATPATKGSGKFSFRITKGGQQAVWLYSIADKMATPLIANPGFNQRGSDFSRDGKWIVYRSDESGATGLYVQPFPTAGGAKYLIDSNPNSNNPSWLPDGSGVFFVRGITGRGVNIYLVRIATQPAFTATPAQQANTGFQFERDANVRKYDFGNAGIVLITPQALTANATTTAPPEPQEIRVVLNWFEELNRLVPIR